MKLSYYILLKFSSILLQILGVSMLLFGLYAFTGYDPGVAHAGLGGPFAIEYEQRTLGTNYTKFEQFQNFWKGISFGDCGAINELSSGNCNQSLGIGWEGSTYNRTIDSTIYRGMANTAIVFLLSFVIYGFVGVFLGVFSATKSKKLDDLLKFFTSGMVGIPAILLLIYIYRILLNVTLNGNYDNPDRFNIFNVGKLDATNMFADGAVNPLYYFVPILAHAFISMAFVYRYVREIVIAEKANKYLVTARSKGLSENRIIRKHLLPNIYPKLVNALALTIPIGISNLAFVEFILGFNGLFSLLFKSVLNYNFPVIHAIGLFVSLFTLTLMNFTDIFITIIKKIPDVD